MSDPWSRPAGEPDEAGDEGLRFSREAWEELGLGGVPGHEAGAEREGELRCVELCPICRAADVLRSAGAPPELRGQLHELQREALLTLRTLLDHYLERLDREPGATQPVEEIPIE